MSSAPEGVCEGVQWGHFLTTFGSLFWTLSDFFLDHFRVTFLNTFRFFSWSLSGYFFVWWFCIFWKYIYKDCYYFSSHLCETFLAVAKCQNNFMFVGNQEILCLKNIFWKYFYFRNKYFKNIHFLCLRWSNIDFFCASRNRRNVSADLQKPAKMVSANPVAYSAQVRYSSR